MEDPGLSSANNMTQDNMNAEDLNRRSEAILVGKEDGAKYESYYDRDQYDFRRIIRNFTPSYVPSSYTGWCE